MKKLTPAFILFIFLFAFSLNSFAQKALQVTSTHTGRVETIGKGTQLIYRIKNDSNRSVQHGTLKSIGDSSLVINDDNIPVSQIEIVAINSRNYEREANTARAVGNGLIIAGDIVTHTGLSIFINDDFYVWPVGGTIALVGACIWGIGLLMDEIVSPAIRDNGRHAGDMNWKAEIVEVQKKGKKGKKKQSSKDDDLYGY